MNKIYWLVIFILVIFTIAGGLYFYNSTTPIDNLELEGFAKCVASSGATMYGAAWCSHCQAEKNNFGQYFKYINYIECPDNIKLCEEKMILGYPTWEFSDGSRMEGEQGLNRLSEKTGCSLSLMSPATNTQSSL